MKKIVLALFISLLTLFSLHAQTKKVLSGINSVETKETIEFSYNNKNQLVYFSEKGRVAFREFSLKYDKTTNRLIECKMDQDRGEVVHQIKYTYNDGFITEDITKSGRQYRQKESEQNKISVDENGRLTYTTFDDGNLWEEFIYDANNNLIHYTIYSALGDPDYKYDSQYNDDISAFTGIKDMPLWFWGVYLNQMKWCRDFIGKNNPANIMMNDPRFGEDEVAVTYEYDADGYPEKQYYNGELLIEFTYKVVKK